MTRVYYHKLTVHVISTIESPDVIERKIDELTDIYSRFDARTDADNRRNGPCRQIDTQPDWPAETTKENVAAYHLARDAWRDTWPTVDTFNSEDKK